MFHVNNSVQAFLVTIIVGQHPAISTVINTRLVHLTAAGATCIQCERLASDTETERPSSTYAVCGNVNTLNTYYISALATYDIPGK